MKTITRHKVSRSDRTYVYSFTDTSRPTDTGYETATFILHVAGIRSYKRPILTRLGQWPNPKEITCEEAAFLIRWARN